MRHSVEVSASSLYEAVRAGRAPFPVLRISRRRMFVPTAGLRETLGLHATRSPSLPVGEPQAGAEEAG